jgi:hypothetical protein
MAVITRISPDSAFKLGLPYWCAPQVVNGQETFAPPTALIGERKQHGGRC